MRRRVATRRRGRSPPPRSSPLSARRSPQTCSSSMMGARLAARLRARRLAAKASRAGCAQGCPLVSIPVSPPPPAVFPPAVSPPAAFPPAFPLAPVRSRSQANHRIPPRAAIRGRQAGQRALPSSSRCLSHPRCPLGGTEKKRGCAHGLLANHLPIRLKASSICSSEAAQERRM